MGKSSHILINNKVVRTMTVKELIELLQGYPNQDMPVMVMDSENGEEDIVDLEEHSYYVGCTHYPKLDSHNIPMINTGTYYHNESCRSEVRFVALRS